MDDRIAGQGTRGDARQLPCPRRRTTAAVQTALDDRDVAVGRHPADDRNGQAPALADLAHRVPPLRQDGGAHPLLRLGDHDFEWLKARLAPRDGIEVHGDAGPRPVRGLRSRTGDAAGAEVLEPLDKTTFDQFQAGLDQELLRERVADLDRRPLRWVVVGEGRTGQDGGAADPISSSRRTEQHDQVARSGRGGQRQKSFLHQPDGHDVDQRVAVVARVEHQFAADRRDADAVAVATNAADDPVHEMPRPWVRRVTEAKRVEDGDGPRAHREDIAQDAADAGRRALVRLDRRGVVVRFDLERDCQPVPDRDDPGILARPGDDPFAGDRERA
jgi:hypothetical protein